MKRTHPELLRTLIDRAMEAANRQEEMLQMRAAALWGEVVGPGINAMTRKRFCSQGILNVHLTSAPLKADLQFQREEIRRQINEILGKEVVKSIRLY